ncbi:MAG: hypothetical protein K8S98_06160 [Planctomycetes bacterium]|nr:hypothetical protein [Planctomycetota bacterium]
MKLALLTFALLATACASHQPKLHMAEEPPLASAARAGDYDSYPLRRVGLLPFAGGDLDVQRAADLQRVFALELGERAGFEVIALDADDLEAVDASDPYRRGVYRPTTIIELARRYRLDGLLVGTVTQMRTYTPQRLSLELELVAAETGQAIWRSTLALDSGADRVKRSIDVWCNNQRSDGLAPENSDLVLLSPARFAQFAAYEVARVL